MTYKTDKSSAGKSEIQIANPHAFTCDLCDFWTIHKSALTAHSKSHQKCDDCGITFSGARATDSYNQHNKTYHFKPIFDCKFCEEKFKNCEDLKCHVEDSHKGSIIKGYIDFKAEKLFLLSNFKLCLSERGFKNSNRLVMIAIFSKRQKLKIMFFWIFPSFEFSCPVRSPTAHKFDGKKNKSRKKCKI